MEETQEERIISAKETNGDKQLDMTLRPKNLEEYVANFFIDKIIEKGVKKNAIDDIKDLGKVLSKTIFSRLLK